MRWSLPMACPRLRNDLRQDLQPQPRLLSDSEVRRKPEARIFEDWLLEEAKRSMPG
jgi:hypothetical protein